MAARIEYLLTSEDFIKSCTNISDNLSGKYLQGAIREAQETALRDVLGSCLLDALKARLAEGHGTLPPGWYKDLADRIKADIRSVSPETKVVLDNIELKDPWDFEEVYSKFYDYSKSPCFHEDKTSYYIHISTGSHVEKICLFLLVESHHLNAKIVQSSPKEGHVRHSNDPKGTINVIDLDLSRYDALAKRFETERQKDLSFLKQGIATRNAAFKNNPKTPPSSRDEGLRLLHGLETNLATSLQTPQEA